MSTRSFLKNLPADERSHFCEMIEKGFAHLERDSETGSERLWIEYSETGEPTKPLVFEQTADGFTLFTFVNFYIFNHFLC